MYFTSERAEWKPITGNYNKYKCPNSSTRIYGLCLVKQVYQVIRFMIVKQVVCRDFCLLQKHWIHQRRWLIKGQTTKAQLFQDPGFLMTSQCPEQCDKMLWLALKRYYIKAWSRFEISFWTLMAESAADWKITPAFQVSNSKLQSSAKSQISLFRERVTSSSSQTAKLPPWTNVVLDGCSTVIIYKICKCIKKLCMDKCICSTNQRFSKDGILFCVLKKCVSSSYQRFNLIVDDGIYK